MEIKDNEVKVHIITAAAIHIALWQEKYVSNVAVKKLSVRAQCKHHRLHCNIANIHPEFNYTHQQLPTPKFSEIQPRRDFKVKLTAVK